MPISKVIFKASASATPEVWMDSTTATATAEDIMAPKTAMLANGVMTTGTGTGGGSGNIYQDENGYIVLDPSGDGSGGGGDENPIAMQKQINFVDYDGTIRYSYSAAEFVELSELPANPSHTGKIAQGWNWTMAQINAHLLDCLDGPVWVGQQYTTEDGKTHLIVVIPAEAPASRRIAAVRFTQTASYGGEVDWGDGSSLESHSSSSQYMEHTYAEPGEYDISVDVVDGTISFSNPIYGSDSNVSHRGGVREIAIGDGVSSIGDQVFYGMYSHVKISMPSGLSGGAYYAYGYCNSLVHHTIPDGSTQVSERMYRYDYALTSVSIPAGVTSIGPNAFYECTGLRSVTIPLGVTSIAQNAFYGCYGLRAVHIPSSVTSIGASAFANCGGVGVYHIRATTPPTLDSSVFSSIASDCVIYVPAASVNTYKTATNWSTYASYIQAEPS